MEFAIVVRCGQVVDSRLHGKAFQTLVENGLYPPGILMLEHKDPNSVKVRSIPKYRAEIPFKWLMTKVP